MIRNYIYFRLLIILFILSSQYSFGQCSFMIPDDANVFDSSKTVTSSGNDIFGSNWICAGDTLVITSGFGSQVFFLEENAVLYGGGGGNRTVFLKPGAKFDCGGGGSQVITYDTMSSWTFCGSVDAAYCHPLTFNYTNAPANGCSIAASVKEVTSERKMKIFPVPSDEFVEIDFSAKGNRDYSLQILGSIGNEILRRRISEFPFRVNSSAWTTGIYSVMLLENNEVVAAQKMIITR